MPKGPQGEKRPGGVIGAAVMVAKIATGEIDNGMEESDPFATETPATAKLRPQKGSWMGSLRGQIWIAPDAFDRDEELIRQMEDGPIFPEPEAES